MVQMQVWLDPLLHKLQLGAGTSSSWRRGQGNSNARVLREILQANRCITDIDLHRTGLDDDGARELTEALKSNSTVRRLNLRKINLRNENDATNSN